MGANFESSLLKSKSKSDLKETKINPSRLESYFLDSLWQNFQYSMKTEEKSHVVQNFHPYIPPTVQTPPAFQAPPCVPNPPRQMAARFSPLALPDVFHGLPQNYAQKIPFYDGDGSFTSRQHVNKFYDYADLDLVDDDDINMCLFVLSFSEEAMKWLRDLPTRSIATFEAFQTLFLERWGDKTSPL